MLCRSDVQRFLRRLPKDFPLTVNGNSRGCNKQSLCAFSAVVRSAVSSDPSLAEFRLDIPVSPQVVADVVAFLRGRALNLPDEGDVFEYFYLGAALGIDVLSKRLIIQVFRSMTNENVQDRFRLLGPFPAFWPPIIMFLETHRELFETFIQENVFPSELIRAAIKHFPSEDDKFIFLRKYIVAADAPDFTLFRRIRLEELSASLVPTIFDDTNISRNCKTFRLLARLIAERKCLRATRQQLDAGIDLLRHEMAAFTQASRIDDSQIPQLVADAGTEYQVRNTFLVLADKLDMSAACIALLTIGDECASEFVRRIDALQYMNTKMSKMLAEFKRDCGWLLYPGSSKKSRAVSQRSKGAVADLQKLSTNFIPNPSAVQQVAQSIASIADALRRATEAPDRQKNGDR
jgi:hypothetical protein